jgi:predicted nucleic acid-binding protein
VRRVVVDASFSGALILEDEVSEDAEALLLEALQPGGPVLMAPTLWTYEMLNLLKAALKRKRLTRKQASHGLKLLGKIPIQLIDPHGHETRVRIFEISVQHDLTAYDASYFELADRLDVDLFSNDRKLINAFSKR